MLPSLWEKSRELTMSMIESVSEFYGKTVKRTEDLAYDACCVADYTSEHLANITDEVKERRYGCGSPLPELLAGCTVLDLGCGAGIDCFIASQLVGESGRVIGLDMTEDQLAIARRNVDPITKNIGYAKPNVEFKHARIEEIPLEDNSIDVVISNCVINLSEAKHRVFGELHRVLKPGGEFFIADIIADRRIPARLAKDARLYSECLTGAAYNGDLHRIMRKAGFQDVRTVQSRLLADRIEGIHFHSATIRGFKLDLEDACEDYGQVAVYNGTIEDQPREFVLDQGHRFQAGVPMRVCKNTADMIRGTRFAAHFAVSEEMFHMGLFDCGPKEGSASDDGTAAGGACC